MSTKNFKKYYVVLIIIVLMCFIMWHSWSTNVDTQLDFRSFKAQETDSFLINTEGCVIQHLDPFDSSIKRFIFEEFPVKCNDGIPPLMSSNLTSIYFLEKSFPSYNITDMMSLSCCYKPFWRVKPDHQDNKVKFSDSCVNFKRDADITDEFIEVKCELNNTLIYTDYFAFIPLIKQFKAPPKRNGLNVLIMGLDSISRLNFIRQMPKTVKVLKDLLAVEFLGYNKVGDNTFPNLIPILTGLNEEELKKLCWEKQTDRFDKCPFIWKKYREANFTTVFAEDASWMGLVNYQRNGFFEQPTDYHWGYFNYNAIKSIGNMHNMNVHQCMGSTEDYVRLLDYAEKFVETMSRVDQNYFGFFWQSSLSHDYLNKPKLGDDKYSGFLLRLKEKGYLNNTALIFLSDHGIRWGDIRTTFQGYMEERLPFLYIYLPLQYRNDFAMAYSNLLSNSKRLTTPFDLHDTLEDFLHPFRLTKQFLTDRSAKIDPSHRQQSLFNILSKRRTCDSTGIPEHFCTCQKSVNVSTTNQEIENISIFSVNHINYKLSNYSECVVLELVEVISARVLVGSDEISKQKSFSDFTVTFKTTPGEGIFETTVRKNLIKNEISYEVLGSISRLNLYGTQSFCMEDFHLKLFCYCRQLLMSNYS